jgi:hypothetical protein
VRGPHKHAASQMKRQVSCEAGTFLCACGGVGNGSPLRFRVL